MSLYNESELFLEELSKYNWKDPNPPPVIEKVQDYYVVRDDLLGYGTKARFIDCLVKSTPVKEWVYGGTTKVGWGPISLAKVCSIYQKLATVFAAKRTKLTEQQEKAIFYGANFRWLDFGMLSVCEARARDYQNEDKKNRMLLPIGLEHPLVFGSIIKVARDAINPQDYSEIWTVGGSGTLSRGLQLAFPGLPTNIVQIGHKMSPREIGRAKLYISPYKYDQPVKEEELPPYPSERYYDAKIWPFVKKHAKPGALIWNVA